MSNSVGGLREEEVRDVSEKNNITMNKSLIFSFVETQALTILYNSYIIQKKSVTLTKILKNSNSCKRSINDLFFTSEPVT